MKKLLLALLLLTAQSYAQSDTTVNSLPEANVVSITSGKNLPISMTKIKCADVNFLNKQGDPYFIFAATTPSIYAQSDNGDENGYSYMRLRGLDQTRVNYNLNGVPLNEMEDQGLYFSNMPGLYNYLGEINIERGVGSSKYGNTSIAGSVNMETRAMSEKTFEITTLLKDATDKTSNVFYSSGINSKGIAVQLAGSIMHNDGYRDHSENNGGSLYYSLGKYAKNNSYKITNNLQNVPNKVLNLI